MASRTDLLLGQIALEKGFISQDQLDECLKVQESNPQWKQLGMIFLDSEFISEEDLEIVLEIQRKNLEKNLDNSELKLKDVLFGRIVVSSRFATQGQVNECLREQERIERMGMFMRLGEILVKKGYLSDENMSEILSYQNEKLEEFRQDALGEV
ncbi:MAG: hypothetical protein ACYTFG_09190 [Planctomycetota bacterium]|jgi:hypothetical protein